MKNLSCHHIENELILSAKPKMGATKMKDYEKNDCKPAKLYYGKAINFRFNNINDLLSPL